MAKKLAVNIIRGDKIIVSLGAARGGTTGERQSFAGTFNHLGEEIDSAGQLVFGKPRLDLAFQAPAAPAPVFPIDAFNRAVEDAGGKPSATSMRIQAKYEEDAATWDAANGGTGGGTLGDRIGKAVLTYVQQYYGISTNPNEGAYIDPAQVVVRPAYRMDELPVVFSVTLAPVWGGR